MTLRRFTSTGIKPAAHLHSSQATWATNDVCHCGSEQLCRCSCRLNISLTGSLSSLSSTFGLICISDPPSLLLSPSLSLSRPLWLYPHFNFSTCLHFDTSRPRSFSPLPLFQWFESLSLKCDCQFANTSVLFCSVLVVTSHPWNLRFLKRVIQKQPNPTFSLQGICWYLILIWWQCFLSPQTSVNI